jgi:DNA-binding transcriptional MerR regulator
MLSIGDFARATHLSAKALRHYHQLGLLTPAETDPHTGYRYYSPEQITTARLIRRFRELQMPLDDIRAVITTADVTIRHKMISRHLSRLEAGLQRTQDAVTALRGILDGGQGPSGVTVRRIQPVAAIAITAQMRPTTIGAWFHESLIELNTTATELGATVAGPAGAVVASELFTDEQGEVTLFLPIAEQLATAGHIVSTTIPGGEFAVTTHCGSHADVDRSYAQLGEYVARFAFGLEEPIREYYPIGPPTESSRWLTEICWPVLSLRP